MFAVLAWLWATLLNRDWSVWSLVFKFLFALDWKAWCWLPNKWDTDICWSRIVPCRAQWSWPWCTSLRGWTGDRHLSESWEVVSAELVSLGRPASVHCVDARLTNCSTKGQRTKASMYRVGGVLVFFPSVQDHESRFIWRLTPPVADANDQQMINLITDNSSIIQAYFVREWIIDPAVAAAGDAIGGSQHPFKMDDKSMNKNKGDGQLCTNPSTFFNIPS